MRTPAYVFNNTREGPAKPHRDAPTEPEPYLASEQLKRAVNLAIALERPLLLEGEAGCGKTRLARAVAFELGLPFYSWSARSTSKAQEGLYTYDAMLRLHDVHMKQRSPNAADAAGAAGIGRDPQKPADYLRLGALGKAFERRDCPSVVLIDEIDKADIDFPNDLLTVLDDPWEFEIPEMDEANKKIKAAHKPIIVVTSNKEKGNLPAPFLRRCVYFYLDFPGEKELEAIVAEHYRIRHAGHTGHTGEKQKQDEAAARDFSELAAEAARRFRRMRDEYGLHKKPGTSEFLDWMRALSEHGPSPYTAKRLEEETKPPYPELLFKLRADWQRYGV